MSLRPMVGIALSFMLNLTKLPIHSLIVITVHSYTGGFSVFAGVGERTREGNDLYREMIESGVIKLGDKQVNSCYFPVSLCTCHIKAILFLYIGFCGRAKASVLLSTGK